MSQQPAFTGSVRRYAVVFAALIAAAAMIPVAIAYACNPQARLKLDQISYQPGETISASGIYFPRTAQITLSGPTGSKTVTTSPGGAFQETLQAPSSPGNYTVTASRPTGGFAPASFRVASPATASPSQPSQGSPAGSPPASAAPGRSAPAPTAQTGGPSFRTPGIARSQPSPVDRAVRGSRPATRREAASRPAPTRSGVTTSAGQRVFANTAPAATASVPTFGAPAPTFAAAPAFGAAPAPAPAGGTRSQRAANGSGGTARPAPAGRAPAAQTALSDLYSNYQPGRTPSLGGAPGVAEGGAGSSLPVGIGLLALALVALVSGLTVAEVRRRRLA